MKPRPGHPDHPYRKQGNVLTRNSFYFRKNRHEIAAPTEAELEAKRRLIMEYLEKNEVKKCPPGFSRMDL